VENSARFLKSFKRAFAS